MKKLYYSIIFSVCVGCALFYLYSARPHNVRLPMTLSSAATPLAKVEIQGREFILLVDSGSKFQLDLDRDVLDTLDKQPCGTLQSRDIRGASYDSTAYLVQKIKIGNRVFNNVVVVEVNEDFVANATFFIDESRVKKRDKDGVGVVGRALLEKANLCFDFPNLVFFECGGMKGLKKAGYPMENLVAVPFEGGRAGAALVVETDFGPMRLSLDTGSTLSIVRSSLLQNYESDRYECGLPCVKTSKFQIGGRDFGSMELHPFEVTPELHEMDGLLGMDFLKNHVVYVDYQDKVIYIGDSKVERAARALERSPAHAPQRLQEEGSSDTPRARHLK